MAVSDRLSSSLQEDLLTLLVHSDENGRVVANLVDPTLFEGDYRRVAENAVDYWRRYGRAPGPHMANLLSDILEDPHDKRAPTFRNLLIELLRLSEVINAKYAIDNLRTYVRAQKFKQAVHDAAKRFSAKQELALPEIEEMWAELLRSREHTFERGLDLNDTQRLIKYMQTRAGEFSTGIDELDRSGIVPVRGEVMLLLASTGIGKSWGLIHLAKRAMMERKRVVYVSVELGEEILGIRFWQSIFAVPKRAVKRGVPVLRLEREELGVDDDGRPRFGKLLALSREVITPDFALDSSIIEDEMEAHRRQMEGRFRNLIIKRFPTRQLTVAGLEAYLDNLAQSGFSPDVLVLDYIGKMKTDAKDHRISLGRTFEDFYGLCVERNIAGITAQQASREGGQSRQTTKFNVAEDWSLIGTADVAISISATSAEKRFGFARLYVEKGRNERDQFGVLITQNYDTGQFVLDSAPMDDRYDGFLEQLRKDAGDDADDVVDEGEE